MDVERVVAEVDAQLLVNRTPERAVKEKAYLKSALEHYGTSVPAIRSVVTTIGRQHRALDHDELMALVAALWVAPVHERRMAAVEFLDLYVQLLEFDDMGVIEQMLREARAWAFVDALAASIVGSLAERTPEMDAVLDRWSTDDDFWIRRSALLALLKGLRRGEGDFDRFSRYADTMLDEKEFFIRKAIGWVLRETAKQRPAMVYEWLLPRAKRVSGVTMREAVKWLSDEQRDTVLAAR
jgi:3-methyladenine DNA glycosylase AlkD